MLSLTILVAFGKTKIDNVNVITSGVGASNEEIVWLDITMDYSLLMDFLDTADELNRDHQNCF